MFAAVKSVKSERLFSLKEKVGKSLPHQESLDSNLKYFSKEKEQFSFAKESSYLTCTKLVCQ